MSQSFNVWKAQDKLGLQDPDFNYTRYHTVVFVETDADGGGRVYHVTGDVVTGMRYETKPGPPFDQSDNFHTGHFLGLINAANHPAAMDALLQTLPAPHKQKVFSTSAMAYVRCKPNGSLYAPGETVPPLIKCTEWTEQRAIPALFQHGLIEAGTPLQSPNALKIQQQQTAVTLAHMQPGHDQPGQAQQ